VASADRPGTPGDAVTRRSSRFAPLALSSPVPYDSACLLVFYFCLDASLSFFFLPGDDSDSVTASCLRPKAENCRRV
jgi:hypothetical protein